MFETLEPSTIFNSNVSGYGLSDFKQSYTQAGLINPFGKQELVTASSIELI